MSIRSSLKRVGKCRAGLRGLSFWFFHLLACLPSIMLLLDVAVFCCKSVTNRLLVGSDGVRMSAMCFVECRIIIENLVCSFVKLFFVYTLLMIVADHPV